MITLYYNGGSSQKFPTLKRAVNFLEDLERSDLKPYWTYLEDSKASKSYTVPHPSSKKKPSVFVRAPVGGAS